MMPTCALTVAASDPSGGAGVEMDLKVFQDHQVFGLTAITALTIQSSRGLKEMHPTPAEVFEKILAELDDDIPLQAIKIGAVASAKTAELISEFLDRLKHVPVVLDPVMTASSGRSLVEPGTKDAIMELLMPRSTLISPNLEEASELAGIKVGELSDMRKAAEILKSDGANAVLVKGGHLPGEALDIFYHEGNFREWSSERIKGEFHGTGCALSAGIAAGLANGQELEKAVQEARAYLHGLMKSAFQGKGEACILFPGSS